MHTKEDIVNSIKYFQMYLGEVLSYYQLNDAICDFYDTTQGKFNEYGNCLGYISSALNYRQHMLCYLLFYYDKDSKSIPRLINEIRDNRVLADKELDHKLKNVALKMAAELDSFHADIENLMEYRHNVYAHWNKKVFNDDWQTQFKKNHTINYKNILLLCQKCFEYFSDMLIMMGEEPFVKSFINDFEIKHFISQLKR